MNRTALPRAQRGATLIVGLIMLVIITLVVTSAFMMSNTNLKSVGNMQIRDETLAAANLASEDVLGSLLIGGSTVQPPARVIPADINNDGVTDYSVSVSAPECVRVSQVGGGSSAPGSGSSTTLGLPSGPPPTYSSVWDIDATVTDSASGASVRVRQGVRVLLTQAQKDSVCP